MSGQTSIATVDDQGRVSTGNDAGRVTIFASSVDKLGLNQTTAINLEVSYKLINESGKLLHKIFMLYLGETGNCDIY